MRWSVRLFVQWPGIDLTRRPIVRSQAACTILPAFSGPALRLLFEAAIAHATLERGPLREPRADLAPTRAQQHLDLTTPELA